MSTIARRALGIGMMLVLTLLAPARAEIRTSGVFSDHMVLQQGKPLPIWGWAEAGKTITVTLAGKTGSAVAGTDGKWMVKLDALPVGGPHELSIAGDGEKTLKDVMIGEV